ncbi:MAG: ABC transporter permease [Spirochaetaceae bacterium]|nr:MAG: ABC transporter permease [Spirochaetaceae bacterium]
MIFIARRLLLARRARGAGVGGMAILGIAAGVATLVAVLAVMNGFQMGMIESILEINSHHLRIETDTPLGDHDDLRELAEALSRVRGIRTVSPVAELQTLARGFWPEPQGIVVRAVPPGWPRDDPGAAERMSMIAGRFDLDGPGSVVLGSELARSLGVRTGDSVAVTHIPGGGTRPAEQQLLVTGLFRTGHLDFDRSWAFVSIATAVDLLEAQESTVLGIKLDNRFSDITVEQRIRPLLTPDQRIVSWREYNRGIFGALRVEKGMMTILIGLIFLVVAGSIYQLLRRSIMERSEDIAILQALGAPPGQLRLVFVMEGWMIGAAGTFLGLMTGLALALNVNGIFAALEVLTELLVQRGVRVFSPSHFYILEVPVRILPWELFLVAAGAIGISVLASALAARAVAGYRPMELLRGQ